ncbi:MAG TPA: phosphoglycerate dehydrogenase [Bryobacteraceae bacterium]|nr:phosphoglycerate dehydrogenase [Bryobacteraceae bacterium]HPU73639.1 phosphoglycerate dehydrogenase [Bryobacteraceae bacterium]
MNILIAEPMAAAGIELLKAQPGWNVMVSNPKEYQNCLAEADALIVRSAVKVTKEVLEKAPRLRVIGRAGVGVDNVDLDAATAAGVLVMNTPGGNAISVAEHTIALMLALARSIPQASFSTKSGKWEKKKFLGHEVRGKTLGIIGLGSIGREVVRRALAFEMRILAVDPYVNPQVAADLGVELVELPKLLAESDYISLHTALTPETRKVLSREAFEQMKPGVCIINCARGEMIDEEALVEALRSGKVAGAALDVFKPEPPPPDLPLLAFDNVLATPHIAGSTEEAQEIVGLRIAEQIVEYLKNGVAINAVNMPALTPEQYRTVGPYIGLAERLGSLAAQIATGNPKSVRLVYSGKIGDGSKHLIRNGGLVGLLNRWLSHRATLVNAMQLATQRELAVEERHTSKASHVDSVTLELETDLGRITVEGALVLGKPRLMQVDGIYCEAPLSGDLLFMKNEDVPGVIGHVGTVLGQNGVNIANFSLGRGDVPPKPGAPLEALAVVETDGSVPESVIAQLKQHPAVKVARAVHLG